MAGKIFKTCAIGATVVGLSTLICFDAQAAVTYGTRALTGGAAPGTEPSVVYRDFTTPPVLNGIGQVAFQASLSGQGVDFTNALGIWSEGSGSLNLVVRTGDAALGTGPGVVYGSFSNLLLNAAGQTAFQSLFTGPGVDNMKNRGLWSEGSGSLVLIAREDAIAPGTGVEYSSLNSHVFNWSGQTAFHSFLAGPGVDFTNDEGIWSEGGGSLNLVAREGDAAPGTELGTVYTFFTSNPVLDGAGQTTFLGRLIGPDVLLNNNSGIWSDSGGSLHLIIREGDAAPGTALGEVYDFLPSSPVVNSAGRMAFQGFLAGPNVDSLHDGGIWSDRTGPLQLIVREGDQASGAGTGVKFTSFKNMILNAEGHVAFIGFLKGPGVDNMNDEGIWLQRDDSLNLVTRAGDAAPGTGLGVMFGTPYNLAFGEPVFNGVGQTAFLGSLRGSGVDLTNDSGIWATDREGLLTLIVRQGDLFDINEDPLIDEFLTISSIEMATGSGGEDGRPTSFNDAGQLAFQLGFTDGSSGIFVATIPEPGTLTLFAITLPWVLRRRG